MSHLIKKFYEKYSETSGRREDVPVLDFLKSFSGENLQYLEVASGLGRFPLLLHKTMPTLNISCVEINKELTHATVAAGIPTIVGDILEVDLGVEKYDIIHCSHIIEHFGYPDITRVLDTILRNTKKGGYIVIRTPLLYPGFYKEIDHVRPYPPESIFNYFNNPQQQKIGANKIREVSRWYRREAAQVYILEKYRLVFYINLALKLMWVYVRIPFSRRTGYVLIVQKES
jgi:SAM-dependent methyltransferase